MMPLSRSSNCSLTQAEADDFSRPAPAHPQLTDPQPASVNRKSVVQRVNPGFIKGVDLPAFRRTKRRTIPAVSNPGHVSKSVDLQFGSSRPTQAGVDQTAGPFQVSSEEIPDHDAASIAVGGFPLPRVGRPSRSKGEMLELDSHRSKSSCGGCSEAPSSLRRSNACVEPRLRRRAGGIDPAAAVHRDRGGRRRSARLFQFSSVSAGRECWECERPNPHHQNRNTNAKSHPHRISHHFKPSIGRQFSAPSASRGRGKCQAES
jgi:hypothetical protein